MVTIARETERKFDATDHDLLPILGGLSDMGSPIGGQEQVLEAVYYDTDDLRLARAGVTLRRRGGGADAGWHLKLPRGGSRVRLERRLGKAGVHRSGSASKLARLLGDRLPTRPAPPTPDGQSAAGRAVLAYLGAQVEEIIRYDPLVRQQVPDSVHRMRVATRRMRSALQVFGKLIQPDRASRLIGELKWLADVLGPDRDLEVLRERFTQAVEALPAEEVAGPVMRRFTRYFARREAAAADDVHAALDDPRYFALLDDIDALFLTRR